MTEPGNAIAKLIYRETAAGAAVTGSVIGDFTLVAAYLPRGGSPTAWSLGAVLYDLGALLGAAWNGYYFLKVTTPSVGDIDAGFDIKVASGTDVVRVASFTGEIEPKDLLSIFNAVNQPVVTLSGNGTIGQVTPLTLIAKRYRQVTFTFVDANGANIDMTSGTTYTNYPFSVRSKTDQNATPPKMDQTTGISAGNGYVTVTILEAASFFSAMPEGASPSDTLEVRYELTADLVAVTGETVSLVQSSPLTIARRETGT
jgi:hypothetical protein